MPVLKKGDDRSQDFYRDKVDLLRMASDTFFGVTSTRHFDVESGRDVWVRDATKASDSKLSQSHEAFFIQKNNALLRCLARLRAIDYAVSLSQSALDKVRIQAIREAISDKFTHLEMELNQPNYNPDNLPAAEKAFNTFLVKQLHEANLAEGCASDADAARLLAHYRVLSSVLDPAMPLVTLTYDEKSKVFQREIQYPVTTKTDKQKAAIEAYQVQGVVANPPESEKNASTNNNLAMQRADACFWDMLSDDKRMLPAQARKTHLVGVKNAFIVHTQTDFGGYSDEEIDAFKEHPLEERISPNNLILARTGIPVFVGKGETEWTVNKHTSENLEQIKIAAREVMGDKAPTAMHITTLNTDSRHEKQDVMLSSLRHETVNKDENQHEMSNVPTNDYGTTALFSVSLNPKIYDAFKERKGKDRFWWNFGQKANRLKIAVDATLAAISAGYLSVVLCASGQDRTGSVVEKTIEEVTLEQWMYFIQDTEKRVPNDAEITTQIERIQSMRAKGFNAAEIASHMVPGSPGMKPCSRANNWFDARRTFGETAEKAFYLKSADSNKENKVGDVGYLKQPSDAAKEEFTRCRQALDDALHVIHEDSFLASVKASGRALLLEFDEIEASGRNATMLERAKKMKRSAGESLFGVSGRRNAQDLAYVTETLRYATTAVEGLKKGGTEGLQKTQEAIQRLGAIEEVLPGHKNLTKRIAAFAIFLAVAVVIAVMFAYPPFGVAVLATAAMIGAISHFIAAAAATSAVGVISYGVWGSLRGAWEMWSGSYEQGKAKATRGFREELEEGYEAKGDDSARRQEQEGDETDEASSTPSGGKRL